MLRPTVDQTYIIEYAPCDGGEKFTFTESLNRSRKMEDEGDFQQACDIRFKAFQRLAELIPDEETVELSWENDECQSAMLILYCSGIDHFLIGDWEMSTAMFELLLDLDPEDHLEASVKLAYNYIALGEFDSFDEVLNDVNDKLVDKTLLTLWSEFRRNGKIPAGEKIRLMKHFAPYYNEFMADQHPVDETYMTEIAKDNPSKEALARESWLQTEHLWRIFPGFIEALRNS